MPRKTAWMSEAPCNCKYGYGGMQIDAQPWPLWMSEVMAEVMPLCGIKQQAAWPNSCNLNLYEDGGHSVAWHADNEPLFQGKYQDCPIISLSLGEARRFELKAPNPVRGERGIFVRLQLEDGDLCTMEGMMQKHYQHTVPRENKKIGPRINLTWRWLVQHSPGCPLEVERRRDADTGKFYTKEEFVKFYAGTNEWEHATPKLCPKAPTVVPVATVVPQKRAVETVSIKEIPKKANDRTEVATTTKKSGKLSIRRGINK